MSATYQKGEVMLWRVASIDKGLLLFVAEYPNQGDPNEIRLVDQHGYTYRFRKPEGAKSFPSLARTTATPRPDKVDEYERFAEERYAPFRKTAS